MVFSESKLRYDWGCFAHLQSNSPTDYGPVVSWKYCSGYFCVSVAFRFILIWETKRRFYLPFLVGELATLVDLFALGFVHFGG